MRNGNPVRNFESEFLLAIKNILLIGLVVCEEENVYYFDDNFRNFIKNSGGNLLKRKFDAEIAGTSKRLRFSISFEDENDEPESSDDEVFVLNYYLYTSFPFFTPRLWSMTSSLK